MAQPGLAITHERAKRPGLLDQLSSEPGVLAAGVAFFFLSSFFFFLFFFQINRINIY
jgi:hypothetical protein